MGVCARHAASHTAGSGVAVTTTQATPPTIPAVLAAHVEESARLWKARQLAVAAPHFRLGDLARLDERLAAHLDGVFVGGESALQLCESGQTGLGVEGLFPFNQR